MDQLWHDQHVEHAHWLALYTAIVQGAVQATLAHETGKDSEAPQIDYEALATEADVAYSRYAARLRNAR